MVLRGTALLIFMVAVAPGAPALADEDSVTLNGEIEVAEYDDEGNPTSVMIFDPEWGSILISNEGKGGELMNHVGAIASVTGTVVELNDDSGYSYALHVSDYVIEQPADPNDYPAWDPEE
jgi:hypothetical protein